MSILRKHGQIVEEKGKGTTIVSYPQVGEAPVWDHFNININMNIDIDININVNVNINIGKSTLSKIFDLENNS